MSPPAKHRLMGSRDSGIADTVLDLRGETDTELAVSSSQRRRHRPSGLPDPPSPKPFVASKTPILSPYRPENGLELHTDRTDDSPAHTIPTNRNAAAASISALDPMNTPYSRHPRRTPALMGAMTPPNLPPFRHSNPAPHVAIEISDGEEPDSSSALATSANGLGPLQDQKGATNVLLHPLCTNSSGQKRKRSGEFPVRSCQSPEGSIPSRQEADGTMTLNNVRSAHPPSRIGDNSLPLSPDRLRLLHASSNAALLADPKRKTFDILGRTLTASASNSNRLEQPGKVKVVSDDNEVAPLLDSMQVEAADATSVRQKVRLQLDLIKLIVPNVVCWTASLREPHPGQVLWIAGTPPRIRVGMSPLEVNEYWVIQVDDIVAIEAPSKLDHYHAIWLKLCMPPQPRDTGALALKNYVPRMDFTKVRDSMEVALVFQVSTQEQQQAYSQVVHQLHNASLGRATFSLSSPDSLSQRLSRMENSPRVSNSLNAPNRGNFVRRLTACNASLRRARDAELACPSTLAANQDKGKRPRPRPSRPKRLRNPKDDGTQAISQPSKRACNSSARPTTLPDAEYALHPHTSDSSRDGSLDSEAEQERTNKAALSRPNPAPSRPLLCPEEDTTILHYPTTGGKGAVALVKSDLFKLDDGAWLNDTLIDFALRYIHSQLEQDIDPEHRAVADEILILSAFFYTQLTSVKDRRVGYERVRKWTKDVYVFGKRYIVVPINENLHWYLAIIVHPERILHASYTSPSPPSRPQLQRLQRRPRSWRFDKDGHGLVSDSASDLPSSKKGARHSTRLRLRKQSPTLPFHQRESSSTSSSLTSLSQEESIGSQKPQPGQVMAEFCVGSRPAVARSISDSTASLQRSSPDPLAGPFLGSSAGPTVDTGDGSPSGRKGGPYTPPRPDFQSRGEVIPVIRTLPQSGVTQIDTASGASIAPEPHRQMLAAQRDAWPRAPVHGYLPDKHDVSSSDPTVIYGRGTILESRGRSTSAAADGAAVAPAVVLDSSPVPLPSNLLRSRRASSASTELSPIPLTPPIQVDDSDLEPDQGMRGSLSGGGGHNHAWWTGSHALHDVESDDRETTGNMSCQPSGPFGRDKDDHVDPARRSQLRLQPDATIQASFTEHRSAQRAALSVSSHCSDRSATSPLSWPSSPPEIGTRDQLPITTDRDAVAAGAATPAAGFRKTHKSRRSAGPGAEKLVRDRAVRLERRQQTMSATLDRTDVPLVITFDSLRSRHGHQKVNRNLSFWLRSEARDKAGKEVGQRVLCAYIDAFVPQQPNWWDCGIYVIHLFDRFASSPEETLAQLRACDSKSSFWHADEVHTRREAWRDEINRLSAEWLQARDAKRRDPTVPSATVSASPSSEKLPSPENLGPRHFPPPRCSPEGAHQPQFQETDPALPVRSASPATPASPSCQVSRATPFLPTSSQLSAMEGLPAVQDRLAVQDPQIPPIAQAYQAVQGPSPAEGRPQSSVMHCRSSPPLLLFTSKEIDAAEKPSHFAQPKRMQMAKGRSLMDNSRSESSHSSPWPQHGGSSAVPDACADADADGPGNEAGISEGNSSSLTPLCDEECYIVGSSRPVNETRD